MNFLKNIFSSLISSILIVVIFSYLILHGFNAIVLNTDRLNSILKNNDTYQKIATEVVPSALAEAVKNNEGTKIPSEFSRDFFTKSFENSTLATDLEKLFTGMHRYATGQTKTLLVTIDLASYKSGFETSLKSSFATYLGTLATCTSSQQSAFVNQESFPNCRPIGYTDNQILDKLNIQSFTNTVEENLPNTFIVTENKVTLDPPLTNSEFTLGQDKANATSAEAFQNLRKSAQLLQTIERILLFSALGLGLLLIITRLPLVASILKWVGGALFSSSFILLIFSTLFLYSISEETIRGPVTSALGMNEQNTFQKSFVEVITANSVDVFRAIAREIQTPSLVLVAVGLGFLVGAFVYKKRAEKNHLDLKNQTAQ